MLFTDNRNQEIALEAEDFSSEELVRLMDWLAEKGMTDKDILDCIYYVASGVKR